MASTFDSGTDCAAPTTASAGSHRRVALAGALLLLTLTGAAPIASLEVDLAQVRSDRGQLRFCLTPQPQHFPSCVDDTLAMRRSVDAGQVTVRFEGLPLGDYAVAVIHDENGNRKLDTVLGIPREGFGFSRNPRIGFGAPRFAAARFTIDADGAQQRILMRYLL